MVKTNLSVSMDSADGSEKDVVTIKTTAGTHVIIETGGVPKVAVNPLDLQEALLVLKGFLNNRNESLSNTQSNTTILNGEILYGDDEASNS